MSYNILRYIHDLRCSLSCAVLSQISNSGTWSDVILEKVPSPWPIQAMMYKVIEKGTLADKREKDPQIIFASRINWEMKNPGSDAEIGMILRAAAGDLTAVEKLELELMQFGQALPIREVTIVAILNSQIHILQFCVQHHIELDDDDIAHAAYRTLKADIFKILFPLNIFNINSNPEYVTSLLTSTIIDSPRSAKYPNNRPEHNPDAIPMAQFLLKNGAKVTDGVLNKAIEHQSTEFVKLLLVQSGREELLDAELHLSARRGKLEMARLLLDDGAVDVNQCSQFPVLQEDWAHVVPVYGYALHYAVCCLRIEMVKLLLQKGADPLLRLEGQPDAFMLVNEYYEAYERRGESTDLLEKIRTLLKSAASR